MLAMFAKLTIKKLTRGLWRTLMTKQKTKQRYLIIHLVTCTMHTNAVKTKQIKENFERSARNA